MPIIRKRQFEHTITIDGQPVRLLLKRLTVPEYAEFASMLSAFGQYRGAPGTYLSHLEAKKDKDQEEPSVSLDDIKAETEYLKANAVWQRDVFAAFVTVAPNELFEDDFGVKRAITDGGDLYDLCHGQISVGAILTRIYLENSLSEEQKKKLPSRSGSATGLTDEPQPELSGPKQETVAENVESVASVSAAGVTEPCSDKSSGMTVPSSSESVPCAV